jgi:Holliday junction resolvase RusA-like endonuclease
MPKIVPQFIRSTVEAVSLDLPFPPSVNRLWRSTKDGKHYRSPRYQTWFQAAGLEINRQRPGRVSGQFSVLLQLGRPDRRSRDLDNLMKPVLDLLQHHGVIDNDSLAQHVSVHWSDTIKGAHVVVSKWREAVRAAA